MDGWLSNRGFCNEGSVSPPCLLQVSQAIATSGPILRFFSSIPEVSASMIQKAEKEEEEEEDEEEEKEKKEGKRRSNRVKASGATVAQKWQPRLPQRLAQRVAHGWRLFLQSLSSSSSSFLLLLLLVLIVLLLPINVTSKKEEGGGGGDGCHPPGSRVDLSWIQGRNRPRDIRQEGKTPL